MTALQDSPAPANLEPRTRDTKGSQRDHLYPPNASRPRRAARRAQSIAPGLALALAVAAVATIVGQYVPLLGSAVPGAVIGAVIAIVVKPGARFAPGVKWASTFVLQCSVVLLGAQLSIAEAARVGVSSLPVMLGTLAICLAGAWLYRTKRLERARWFLWTAVVATAFPFVAAMAGWVLTEMGRQPWIVWGLLKTSEANSPNVSSTTLGISLGVFFALYGTLAVVDVVLMRRFARLDPPSALPSEDPPVPAMSF